MLVDAALGRSLQEQFNTGKASIICLCTSALCCAHARHAPSAAAAHAGMAAALDLLKERGDLKAPLQWAGRTNDINEAQRLRNEGQLTDVYTGKAVRLPLAEQRAVPVAQHNGKSSNCHFHHERSHSERGVRRLVSMQAGARTTTMRPPSSVR